MDITRTGRLTTPQAAFDTDLRHMAVQSGPGGTVLYTATGTNGGLSAWRLPPGGGAASLIDTESYTVSGVRLGQFDWITLGGGSARLVLEGAGDGRLLRYARSGDGGLAGTGPVDLPGAGGEIPAALAAVQLAGGRSALYMADGRDGALLGWTSDGAGGLGSAVGRTGAAADFTLNGAVLMDSITAWGAPVLLVADQGARGLRSYRADAASGALTAAGGLGAWDGLGISAPTALETVNAHGTGWALLAAAGSGSLSVMRVSPDGGLTLADHLLDTRATRFGGVSALKAVKVGDHVLVLAGGGDDGLSLFELLPDGRLVHRQSLAHAPGQGLLNVTAIEAVELGGALQVFVASGVSRGITRFSVPLDGPGVVAGGGGQAVPGAPLTGTAAADTMLARGSQDHLMGLGGDDILVSGPGGATLTGGAGRDIFVLGPATGGLTVTDFTPGADRLDLTAFAMLRSVPQLTLTPFSQGIRLGYAGTLAEIRSAGGGPLSAAQLFPAGLDTPDRMPIPPGPVVRVTWGTPGDDVITRDGSLDTIRALGGHDVIRAGGGDNRVYGGPGNDEARGGGAVDLLYGETGNDRLYGEGGADQLWGGDGADQAWAGGGDDTVHGGAGNDRLWGGDGRDLLRGGAGDDTVAAGAQDDSAWGDQGRDTLRGGAGADRLWGGAGNDTAYGEAGNDQLWGGTGGDRLYGGAGNDTLHGWDGGDTIRGGDGNDTVFAGGQNDTAYGDQGRDTLWGGGGNDTLYGGAQDDTIRGGDGRDALYGGDGRDTLRGDGGDDTVAAGAQDDSVYGDKGNDTLRGERGNDRLYGGAGNDMLGGWDGADMLRGEAGADTLRGGAGNDTLYGGPGADHLYGESGADMFVFAPGHGADRIYGFAPGVDHIRLGGPGLAAGWAGLDIRAQPGGGTLIVTGGGSVVLEGVAPAALDAGDFLFT